MIMILIAFDDNSRVPYTDFRRKTPYGSYEKPTTTDVICRPNRYILDGMRDTVNIMFPSFQSYKNKRVPILHNLIRVHKLMNLHNIDPALLYL